MGKYKHHWPSTKEQHAHMRMRELQNIKSSKYNPNELWMYEKLKNTGYKWSRQCRWGYRIFDFWCHELGIAVEVDGPEHNRGYENSRDKKDFDRSGILVLRVRNKNERDANKALLRISESEIWSVRRIKLGLKPLKRDVKEGRVPVALLPLFTEANNAGRSYANSIPNN